MTPPDKLADAIDRLASILEELGVSLDAAVRALSAGRAWVDFSRMD